MSQRPDCDFCTAPADIYKEKELENKIYYCGACYINKHSKLKNEASRRRRDQWVSRQSRL